LQRIEVDYVVIGAGVAGLSCALKACDSGIVALLTKDNLPAGNTPLAQGGIAVALGEQDTPELHARDTLRAGAGACNPVAVEVLVKEGIDRVHNLLQMGFPCDKGAEGQPLLGKEGAHSMARVISAEGDGSGRALAETLIKQVDQKENITIYEETCVIDLLVNENKCTGVVALNVSSGETILFVSRAVVLATGGCGQIFAHTTNHIHCTGDGFALAHRAGARLENMEFVQFHPTALNVDENPMFLVSEAVRGKGAILVNDRGERFMSRHHPWAELAPRDVVARGIFAELTSGNRVFLDVSPLGSDFRNYFPSIHRACVERGFNPPEDPIPVVPAAHFIMGGVKTDLDGRTSIKGLYACGEVAGTGVHGANRLASNSLLEGLVYGYRVGLAVAVEERTAKILPPGRLPKLDIDSRIMDVGDKLYLLKELRELMWAKVGLVRSGNSLSEAVRRIAEMEKSLEPQDFMLKNMVTVAGLIAKSALARRESLGSHFRSDFPGAWKNTGTCKMYVVFKKELPFAR